MLLGITYAFFVTNITPNTNKKSVEVSIGEAKVEYNDISVPETETLIEPGYVSVKSFTVKNTGDVTAKYSIALVDVVNTFSRTQDVTYILYKKQGTVIGVNKDTDFSTWTKVADGIYPKENTIIKASDSITTPEDIYTYALIVTYVNHPTINQNEDQGKIFSGKVVLLSTEDINEYVNPNPFTTSTLAYEIMNNSLNSTNGTTYQESVEGVANAVTTSDDKILSKSIDNDGDTYYFRGNVEDNYVNFNKMCWRIVRIAGDETIKLIMEDRFAECDDDDNGDGVKYTGNWGYDEYPNIESMFKSGNTYTENGNKLAFAKSCIDAGTTNYYFGDDSDYTNKYNVLGNLYSEEEIAALWGDGNNGAPTFYFKKYKTLKIDKTATFICDNVEVSNYKTTYITADEAAFAGGTVASANTNYYLVNSYQMTNSKRFVTSTSYGFYTEYPNESQFVVNEQGKLVEGMETYYEIYGDDIVSARAVVSLIKDISVTSDSGNGLRTNPYKVG